MIHVFRFLSERFPNVQAVAQDATSRKAPILVTGNNVEVTEPLKEYIEKKMVNVLDKVSWSHSYRMSKSMICDYLSLLAVCHVLRKTHTNRGIRFLIDFFSTYESL